MNDIATLLDDLFKAMSIVTLMIFSQEGSDYPSCLDTCLKTLTTVYTYWISKCEQEGICIPDNHRTVFNMLKKEASL